MRPTIQRLREFLVAHQVLTLAVVTADGEPHAAAVFYAGDQDLALYFLSDPRTRHGQALSRAGCVAGTIQGDAQRWRQIRGLQLRGRCRRAAGADLERAWEVYGGRYPFLRRPAGVLARALRSMVMWQLEPDWARLIDNRAGFGRRSEWTRAAAGRSPLVTGPGCRGAPAP